MCFFSALLAVRADGEKPFGIQHYFFGSPPVSPCRPGSEDKEAIVQFRADGYYFYLYPFFEDLKKATHQMIDLYCDARFVGPALEMLAGTLREARARVEREPTEWEVVTGWADPSKIREIKDVVKRDVFLELLTRFEGAAAHAIASGEAIICLGD